MSGLHTDIPGDSVARVVDALVETPGLTRAELGLRVGLTRAPVGIALAALAERGLIEQRVDPGTRATGRPPRRIYLAKDAGYSIALDVGKESLSGGLYDLQGRELAAGRVEAGRVAGPIAVLAAGERLVAQLLARAALPREELVGVGVGLAAPVGAGGIVVAGGADDDWVAFPFGAELERRVGIPVDVDNDANLGALGEYRFGAGQGCDDMLYLRLSAGIGLGLILDGRVYRGGTGIAGEFGHIPVDPKGALCACGNRGCVETVAAPQAVVEDVYGAGSQAGVEAVIGAAAQGDRRARRALADAGGTVGSALAAAVTLLNPRRVVVGGDLAAAGELVLAPLTEALGRRALAATGSTLRVVPGDLGHRAELLGAASLHLPRLAGKLIGRLAAA